ncbi:LuxR C-terminal-related transcriptional regulator [Streptomyces sp. NBC_01471]|uniref:helix-turn-helix transcriptional regulator n=1 Tax=Streptomyces sp. NBC_01471 TaxID=2903879 RepID=UPI00324CCE82
MNEPGLSSRRGLGTYLAQGLGRALAPGSQGPSAFVVTGGTGAGKSWTLREVCSELREALPDASASLRQAGAAHLADKAPYGLAKSLLGVDLASPVPADAEDRLLARLDALCATAPLVLVIDDAHEADAASLAVLNRMVAASRDLPLALLVGRRPSPEREYLKRLLSSPIVRETVLPPLDERDVDALVHEHTGRWPTGRLRSALLPHRGNPLRLTTLLDDLDRAGVLDTGDVLELRPGPQADDMTRRSLDEAVTSAVQALEGPAREVARILAVLGRPAATEEIAAVAQLEPIRLVEAVQVLVDRGVASFDADELLGFTHAGYRVAVERGTPAPLLRVLHSAAAQQADPADRIRHVIASGATPKAVLSAVQDAENDLAHAPAVEADLLALPTAATGASMAGVALAVRRARALSRSGQMTQAETVARTALLHATEPRQTDELRLVLIFALSARGEAHEALSLMNEALDEASPSRARDVLQQQHRQLTQLGGLEPLALRPPTANPLALTLTGLVTEAVRLCLTGSPHLAVELAWEASRRHMSRGVRPYEGSSSDIWPPFVELAASGPRAAYDAVREVQRLADERAAQWQSVPHQLLRASIDMSAGRLDDAAAAFDAGLELADSMEFGWTSHAVGSRAMIDVLRGDPDAAETRLAHWNSEPRPLIFGLPQPGRAEVSLLEARRRYAEAARLARTVWRTASEQHLYTWLTTVAPEFGRAALLGGDEAFCATIAQDLRQLPRPLPPPLAASVRLAEALACPDPGAATAKACAAAAEAESIGETLTALTAWEEAAVAAAKSGSKDEARQYARQALEIALNAGAAGVAQRVRARLRALDVRLKDTRNRYRPLTGWDALTPTETQVAEMVTAGLSGPDIARAMSVSTRTVQTHVSHSLAKLGVASRIELAAAVRARSQRPL